MDIIMLIYISLLMIVFFISCLFTFYGARQIIISKSSENWPKTVGTITESSIQTYGRRDPIFYPFVSYGYKVNDKSYEGHTIAFQNYGTHNKKEAEFVIQRYPLKTEVEVFYLPENPATSVLEKYGKLDVIQTVLAFLLLCVSGIFLAVEMYESAILQSTKL
jgi:hypothetical protein